MLKEGYKKKHQYFSVKQYNEPDTFLKKLINSTSNIGLFDFNDLFFRQEAKKKRLSAMQKLQSPDTKIQFILRMGKILVKQ